MSADLSNNHIEDMNIRRLFQELDHEIRRLNTDKISEITGNVSRDAFINVAKTTARLRARYLAKVIELQTSDDIKPDEISALRGSRIMYEEALEGFSALQHALGRGYFSLNYPDIELASDEE